MLNYALNPKHVVTQITLGELQSTGEVSRKRKQTDEELKEGCEINKLQMDQSELIKVVEAIGSTQGEWIQWESTPEDFQLVVSRS